MSRQDGLVVLRSPAGLPFCLVRWRGQERRPRTGNRIESPARDLPKIVDVLRGGEHVGITRLNERIEVGHDVVLPKECAAAAGRVARNAYNLAPLVDGMRFAVHVSWKRAEILDPITSRPQERVQLGIVGIVARLTGKPDHIPVLIDGHRRVPRHASEVADIGHRTVLPQHRMGGSESPYRLVARAGNADDLSAGK